jgi:hypothetical protein
MISDQGIDELKSFASKVGLNPSWIITDALVPHFNINPKNRAIVIAAGAKPVSRKEYIDLLRTISQRMIYRKAG